MNYRDYCNSRDLAWRILINESVHSLPVDILRLCRQLGIKVVYFIPKDDSDGKCTIINDTPYIFVNRNCSKQRKRFTIAHEIGHILLGHVGKYQLVNREPSANDNTIEQSANVVASRLLAPACVLWGCGVRNADHIVKLCDISKPSAEYRMIRMRELYQRDKFLTSPLERQVYKQFQDFILNHQLPVDY